LEYISYAQNFEDVILARVFNNVTHGFYVDIGSFHPSEDSVTKHFYDKGWRGINVEPVSSLHQIFVSERPRDININCAVSDTTGHIKIYEIRNGEQITGLSTLDPFVAKSHENVGMFANSATVPSFTLTYIFEKYLENNEIHFLKIDVEGHEAKVLKSGNFKKFRPWVIVIEATKPNTTIPNFSESDEFLLSVGYKFVYMDGLNCFYLADEQYEFFSAFSLPPNVFDKFELNYHKIYLQNVRLKSEKEELQIELNRLINSLSWRITSPLRKLKSLIFFSHVEKDRKI